MQSIPTSRPHIEDLKIALRAAAYNLTEAYCQEVEQHAIPGTEQISNQAMLWELELNEVKSGSLDALMSSSLVRGNQVKGAAVTGLNRATLRTYLKQVGLFEPKKRVSKIVEAA